MLDYKSLSNKNIINKYDIDTKSVVMMKDLLSDTFNHSLFEREYNGTLVVVAKEYVARPDLISLAVYRNDKYGDVLCKLNGISNPFELNEDMLLFCPTPGVIDFIFCEGTKNEFSLPKIQIGSNKAKNVYIDDAMLSDPHIAELSKTSKTTDRINKQNKVKKKKITDRRSPGEQTENDSNYVINKSLGIVIY